MANFLKVGIGARALAMGDAYVALSEDITAMYWNPGALIMEANFYQEFDGVFSNAALHWMLDINQVVKGVYQSLKSQGRFVGEFGGEGNIQCLTTVISEIFQDYPELGRFINPWYFPSIESYSMVLKKVGFDIDYIDYSRESRVYEIKRTSCLENEKETTMFL